MSQSLPTLPLKSKLPVLCGTILISEILVVYLAFLVGYGLRPVSLTWLIVGASVITVLCVVAAATLPRKAMGSGVGLTLGHIAQACVLLTAFVMPMMLIVGVIYTAMWVVAVYWGKRIDREATEWAKEEIAADAQKKS
ncbi:DUF4233 domain-containing protein [uncultured Brevibacterium sp.]|uniref:DUF4233 domain-containing protein n=1 Tax=uncultured Brevibacterium sp. TaxID=189678 RepID=UPI0025CF7324|nr:DUF4233 domain-containing protein [uncultured Brevibacterium sp.]